MFGQHIQNRSRLVLMAAIGSGLFWSGVGLPLAVQAQGPDPATQLYVGSWKTSSRDRRHRRRQRQSSQRCAGRWRLVGLL